MNYLYSESYISKPISSTILTENLIVTMHHSTITVYDYSFTIIREKYFYEKILDIKKIDEHSFAIIFVNDKLIQITYSFDIICLRCIEGHTLEIFNNSCIVYNDFKLSYFKVDEEEIKEFLFSTIGVFNITKIIFIPAYISTVFIVWNDKGTSKCSIVSLDDVNNIMDSFDIPNGLVKIQSFEKFTVFLFRNYIQVKYKRELITFQLHKDIPIMPEFNSIELNNNVEENIFLENPFIFINKDHVYILNGDGSLYRMCLKFDIKKILKASLDYLYQINIPASLNRLGDFLLVGSIYEDTLLYKIRECSDFGVVELDEYSKKIHYGMVNNLIAKKSNSLLYCTDKCILSTLDHVKLEEINKKELDFIIESVVLINDKIIVFSNKELFVFRILQSKNEEAEKMNRISQNIYESASLKHSSLSFGIMNEEDCLEIQETIEILENDFFDFYTSFYTGNFLLIFDRDKNLNVFKSNLLQVQFKDVKKFSCHQNLLVLLSKKGLSIVSLNNFHVLFRSNEFIDFPQTIYNQMPRVSSDLELIGEYDLNTQFSMNSSIFDEIIEIFIRSDRYPIIFIRTNRCLYSYRFVNDHLEKLFVPKLLLFSSNQKSIFNLDSLIYLNSTIPYFLSTKNGLFFHRSSIALDNPIYFSNSFISISERTFHEFKLSNKLSNADFNLDQILNKNAISRNKLNESDLKEFKKSNINSNNKIFLKSHSQLLKQHPKKIENFELSCNISSESKLIFNSRLDQPKNAKFITIAKNSIILASSKLSPFKFIPFIPMVHTAGPDGKPVSEPIDKDQRITNYPLVLGQSLKFFIELYSTKFHFMSSFELEDYEIVTDLKYFSENFLVVCTSFCEGEDKMSKGRILVFVVADIVPDPEYKYIDKKLKLICSENFKSPVLYCSEIRGYLSACIGTRLMIYEININSGLVAIGRNEIALLSTSLFVIKNYIFFSDIYRGCYFYFLRPKDPLKLHLLGQTEALEDVWNLAGMVYIPESPPEEGQILSNLAYLTLIAYDKSGTMHLYTYSPEYRLSNQGMRLVKRSEINTKLSSLLYNKVYQLNEFQPLFISDNIIVNLRTIQNDNISFIQTCIVMFVEHSCGINLRNYLEPSRYTNFECKSAVSERILLEFFNMSPSVQDKVLEAMEMSFEDVKQSIYNSIYNFV